MCKSLSDLLQSHLGKFGENYEFFLTTRVGFPVINSKNNWVLAKDIKPFYSDKADYFKFLVSSLCENSRVLVDSLPNIEQFVSRLNSEWMKARTGSSLCSRPSHRDEIWFSSKTEQYCWLSNLFPTLIYCQEPVSGIFASLENAYKLSKAVLAGESEERINSISKETDIWKLVKVQVALPIEQSFPLMQSLISCKFKQNRVLQQLLIATTGSVTLVEHTDNSYWGDGSSTKAEERGSGQNKLGIVLMAEREKYLKAIVDDSLVDHSLKG
jgi:ribA/ribD-fused uncharacterized protein